MMRSVLIEAVLADRTFGAMVAKLGTGTGPVTASGVWGSLAPILAAAAAKALDRPLLHITAHMDQADETQDDLELATRGAVELLSAWEALPGEGAGGAEIAGERVRVCSMLVGGSHGDRPASSPVVAPIQALMQPVPTAAALRECVHTLAVGQEWPLERVAAWLTDGGYERVDGVEGPGEFALRGGILDVFSPGQSDPVRVEFFGDQVDSIRQFEAGTQRSMASLDRAVITLTPDASKTSPDETTIALNHLPPGTLIALDEPLEIVEAGRTFFERLDRPTGMFTVEAVFKALQGFQELHLVRFGKLATDGGFEFGAQSLQRFESKAHKAVAELCSLADGSRVHVYCENKGQQDRLTELIAEQAEKVPAAIQIERGLLHRGFRWPGANLIAVGHHELFGRLQPRRRLRRVHHGRPIESFVDLEVGDLVVHVTHGIARYMGMRSLDRDGVQEEYLRLRFADKADLHVPVSQINLVQKYIGAGALRPTLSKLGGTRWKATKERVEKSVTDLAAELLRIQAVRQAQQGIAYPADTIWQREFEEAFVYSETEDQLRVLEDIKSNMTQARPMDRLLCGDVGYGKTELAMRAAFKVVESGRQVAVLVPTTVLAEQHYRTFQDRMADYPFVVERLSRFRKPAAAKLIIEATRSGHVDVLIGTHRLLSSDVGFKELGLVVIDEEQRFGVEHKERLKQIRTTVDVLTMTATPIPRTLHMSMLGIRDISALQTPPMDRRAIATRVCQWDDKLIRQAILRELNRDGQVFFVHNFVHNIWSVADRIRKLVPDARVTVGHGQMREGELERVMLGFVSRKTDVLVCTTIIESGIDIPNCNTIFINQADRFGLADLHQLRGRVGRYKHRAYAYMLLPEGRPITPAAAKRLKAIEEFSDLGAGFRIAMRDLEIRGAGNILGSEQSGHIGAVGYELYCQLLEQSVRKLRCEPPPTVPAAHLDLRIAGRIPRTYINSDRQRMEVYRRAAGCRSPEDVAQLTSDLRDAFGQPPEPVERLLELAEISVLAGRLKIKSIVIDGPDVVFNVDDPRPTQKAMTGVAGTVRLPDNRTVYWRPTKGFLEPASLLPILRRRLAGDPTRTASVR